MLSPYLADDRTMRAARRWLAAGLICVGAVALVGSMRLAWFELRLYTWQGGGCCDRDIDNPYEGLTPWPWDFQEERLPGGGAYLAMAIVAAVAIIATVWMTFGRERQSRARYLLLGCGVAVSVLIVVATVLALNVGVPTSYGDGVVDVKIVPMWGLLAGIVCAVAILGGGVLVVRNPQGRPR